MKVLALINSLPTKAVICVCAFVRSTNLYPRARTGDVHNLAIATMALHVHVYACVLILLV